MTKEEILMWVDCAMTDYSHDDPNAEKILLARDMTINTLKSIEDIKTEIKEYRDACSDGEWDYYLAGRIEAYTDALDVIDKHIGGL